MHNKEWQGCNLLNMSQPSCNPLLNKNKKGGKGLGFRVLDYDHDGFKVHECVCKGRDKRNKSQFVYKWQCKKRIKVKEKKCMHVVMGLGF